MLDRPTASQASTEAQLLNWFGLSPDPFVDELTCFSPEIFQVLTRG